MPLPQSLYHTDCRSAKVRCDRTEPCGRCVRLNLYCYPPEAVQRGRPSRQRKMLAGGGGGSDGSTTPDGLSNSTSMPQTAQQAGTSSPSQHPSQQHATTSGEGGAMRPTITLEALAGPRPTTAGDSRVAPEPQVHGGEVFLFHATHPPEEAAERTAAALTAAAGLAGSLTGAPPPLEQEELDNMVEDDDDGGIGGYLQEEEEEMEDDEMDEEDEVIDVGDELQSVGDAGESVQADDSVHEQTRMAMAVQPPSSQPPSRVGFDNPGTLTDHSADSTIQPSEISPKEGSSDGSADHSGSVAQDIIGKAASHSSTQSQTLSASMSDHSVPSTPEHEAAAGGGNNGNNAPTMPATSVGAALLPGGTATIMPTSAFGDALRLRRR